MKLISNLFSKKKDGGDKSPVDAYFIIESKPLFSIAILKFNKGTREDYHTHAFNAVTWFLKGSLVEENVDGSTYTYHRSILPKITKRNKNHRVVASEDSWCFTVRGRWVDKWSEYNKTKDETTFLTHGRGLVGRVKGFSHD